MKFLQALRVFLRMRGMSLKFQPRINFCFLPATKIPRLQLLRRMGYPYTRLSSSNHSRYSLPIVGPLKLR